MNNIEIFGIINLFILFLTLIAIVIYTIESVKLRKVNKNHLDLEISKLQPNIIVFFDMAKASFEINIIIRNIGGGSAKNVRIEFNPVFNSGDELYSNNLYKNIITKEGLSLLPPNEQYSLFVGWTVSCYKAYNDKTIPINYSVMVEYENLNNDNFKKTFELNINHYFNRISVEDRIIKNLNEINDSLKKISEKT